MYSNPPAVLASVAMAMLKGDSFCLVVNYYAVHLQLETMLAGTRRTQRRAPNCASQDVEWTIERRAVMSPDASYL